MTFLAVSASETIFWVLVLVVVAVVVFGAVALIVTLFHLVRTIDRSTRQLREVAESQAAQGQTSQGGSARPDAGAPPASAPPATAPPATAPPASGPPAGAAADRQPATADSEADTRQRGGSGQG